ncbi:MAG: class I SAM-dependent methyltransferase [Rhodospirillaceae bacterium]|jgi:SAM-dependent methyltransferase|nr:class I SAM-dependent methyltransferase [Rhodospirillaceae bacterium]MBT5083926.1 class I SAM-dependent methyltransferase [Rhodospirillaceae bacterium]MBT5526686.1 class I SAM-dependent methyltransferase [Rhodospirillaceae bacterium]MBT5882316.1 class I SAM-dependent methyltransferase [Rhodospirillaceae bacterium]MBT6587615.1 class I SAM-dependent methyltransferase [Rhodospirillaceae bacterium]
MELQLPFNPDDLQQLWRRFTSVDKISAFDNLPKEFPSVEELTPLWMVLLSQKRALKATNPDDTYYDDDRIFSDIRNGRMLQKNLYEIWLFQRAYPSTILEIGTRTGLSLANKLAFHPSPAECCIVSVDLYIEQGSPEVVEKNLRQLGIDTAGICYVRGNSLEVLPALTKALPKIEYDYILVDGSHERDDARVDLANSIPLLAPDGILVFDDAGPAEDGGGYNLITVWDEVIAEHGQGLDCKHYDVPYGFCVARKSS